MNHSSELERGVSNLSYQESVDDSGGYMQNNNSAVRLRSVAPSAPPPDEQLPPRPPTVPGLFDGARPRHPPPRMAPADDGPPTMKSVDFSKQVEEEEEKVEGGQCKSRVKKGLSVFLSYTGPFLMAVGYMVIGGYLFHYLEVQNEKLACANLEKNYKAKLNESVERTLSFARSGFNETTTRDKMEEALKKFAKDVFVLGFDPTKVCSLIGEPGHLPDWNLYNAMFFCVTIMTTIGYGHIAPKSDWGKIVLMVYSVLGIPIMVVFLTNIGDALATLFRFIYVNVCCCRCFLKRKRFIRVEEKMENTQETTKGPPPKVGDIIVIEDEEEDEGDEYVTIPISVTCFVLVCYMLIGAGLFKVWEKDWTLIDGTYFSFVTLSTIGFGDLVPGKDGFEKAATQVEMVIGSFYCLFGLAILSMCLNLIQDEIVAKFTWLGKKVGLINKDEDLEEEEEEEEEVQVQQIHHDREMSEIRHNSTERNAVNFVRRDRFSETST